MDVFLAWLEAMEGSAALNYCWRKSSYSGNGGGSCVEVGVIPWPKSSHSNGGAQTCVEADHVPGAILIRDTTDNGKGLTLWVTPTAWQNFTTSIRTLS